MGGSPNLPYTQLLHIHNFENPGHSRIIFEVSRRIVEIFRNIVRFPGVFSEVFKSTFEISKRIGGF